jgi:hypothetical protein
MEELVIKFVCFGEILLLHLVSHAAVLAAGGCGNGMYDLTSRMKVL